MKAERTIRDEMRRLMRARHINTSENVDVALMAAHVALEWVLHRGENPLAFLLRVVQPEAGAHRESPPHA